MSVTDGVEATAAGQDGQAYVLHIYPRLSQGTVSCCTLQVTAGTTAATVTQNVAATLGLDMTQSYALLEVRQSGGEERVLEAGDLPVERVLLWPPEAQDQHPQSQGYFFILQMESGPITGGKGNDDLCSLSPLTEDSILDNLRQRFSEQKIYTYASNILIAINPFKFLPIYNPKYVMMYEKQPLGKLSPHIFAVADVAYHTMLKKQANQCIVISGESGSGKTQSTNFLVHCLTALSQKGYSSGVERTILGAGPVLEAFGNAKTAQNNNSSRFGKFIQVNYLESGVVRGAVVEKYLLEKCRLVFRDKSERNYHVFYYLLVGASEEERKEFHLLQPEEYLYLKQENFHLEDEEDLRNEFRRLQQAMEMVGFLPPTKKQIFSVLSAILYLGNVVYTLSEDGHVLEVGPADVLSTLADLLKVKTELLVEALTKRKATTANDTLVLHYTLKEATTARDSMAKSLYSALFDWIVLHINHSLLNKRDMEASVSCLSIGILDIFGFEDFQRNSFEQFCINYANEKLQCYFNQHIFKLEQEEYQKEGITWYNIDYTDNMGCINLISKKPTGLFHLLDEESNLPQATDDTLLDKFKQQHQDNQFFVPTTVMEPAFVIQHFAGRVKYQIQDFREKNTDHMRPDIVALLRSSDLAFMRQLIGSDPVAVFRWGILRATIRIIAAFNDKGRSRHRVDSKSGTRRRSSRLSLGELRKRHNSAVHRTSSHSLIDFSFEHFDDHPLEMFEDIFANYEKRKKSKGNRQKQLIPKNLMDSRSLKHIVGLTLHDRTTRSLLHPHQKKKPPCISAQFEVSLNKLLETLGRAEPFFIRCVRANAEKREMLFDEDLVLQQLRYTGMLEMVRIMKSGYSAKYTFKEFLEKFRVLLPKEATTVPEDISTLLQKMGLEQTTYQIGKTKVFLKEKQRQWLVDTLNKEMMRHIVILQRWFRACLSRKHFLYKKDAATIIQRCWRSFRNETRSRAATVIQAAWRGSHERANYMRKRASIKKMQALVRSRSGWRSRSQEEQRGTETAEREKPKPAQHQRSLESRGLRRQQGLEHSPNRNQGSGSGSGSEVNGQDGKERNKEEGKREARGTPPLNRPLSVPLDTKSSMDGDESPTSHSHTGSVQRHTNTDEIREKAERWKERRNGGSQPDSSPEIHRLRDKRIQGLQNRGKSISMDNVSKISSSGSDSSPSTAEVRVRYRKRTKRKRRLAYPRSGLMFNLGASRESEFWSYPLPPISPAGPRVTSLSSVDVRQGKTLVQFQPPSTVDGARFSLPPRRTSEGSGNPYSTTSQSTTPERYGFLSKFLKKRQQKDFQIPEDAISPSHSQSPYSYRTSSQKPADVRRNPTIKISRATRVSDQTSLDREITDTDELRHLDEFLGNQVNELRTRIKELSATESVFLKSTMQFRESIKSMYSISKPHIGYKGLMKGYHNKVVSLSGPKQKTEVQLVVNLFQSVLDGFIRGEIKREEAEPLKTIKKTKKRKKSKCPNSPLGHMFSTYQVNIMQSCDLCGSYIWGMEKAYMCGACKLVCHKKCLTKIITDCSTRCARKDDSVPGSLHFGVQVCVLTSKAYPVPLVVEMMLEHLEMNGLYTEGIYRKSGSATRARELHQLLETDPDSAYLENYHIHTIAGMIKRWLRELPDPLMTFTLYNDFLHAVELPDRSEQLRAVYQKLDELPSANFNTLERLIFHLVMVAKEETHNLMSANSLAIVFAPCILRSPDSSDPFLGMKDVSKTTTIVEILITEQFRRYHEKMLEITELEYAEALAVKELKLRRQNTIIEKPFSELEVPHMERPTDSDPGERMLIERIKSLKQEKDDLACRLPELEQENSDNDNLDSESSVSSDSLLEGSLDSEGRINTGPKVQKPECPPKSADLAREAKGERSGQPDGQKARTPSERKRRTAVTQSLYILPGQDGSTAPLSPSSLTNNRPCTPRMNRSFSDLDIPFIDEDI